MSEPATTRLSSRGRVEIPEEIRIRLGLEAGTELIVLAENDVVVLKAIEPPSMDEYDEIVSEARKQARAVGLRPNDIRAAIRAARSR